MRTRYLWIVAVIVITSALAGLVSALGMNGGRRCEPVPVWARTLLPGQAAEAIRPVIEALEAIEPGNRSDKTGALLAWAARHTASETASR